MTRAAVFLDRDGVLNETVRGGPPRGLAELVLADGAREATGLLRAAGFVLVVVTNQPDIGRGLVEAADVAAVNAALGAELDLDAVEMCPHAGATPCLCRKPAPGMLLDAAARFGLALDRSWLVGDRWVDIAAGRAAGVRTVLVERSSSWAPTSAGSPPDDVVPDHRVADVRAAAEVILTAGVQPGR